MKKPVFTGAAVAIVTPFTASGDVNYDEFKKIIDHQAIEHGTDAIVIVGTTGESSAMTLKEHAEVVDFGCSYIAGRVPVVAGAGSNDTAAAIELTREAAAFGCRRRSVGYPVLQQDHPARSDRTLPRQSQIAATAPVILYNVPSRTGLSIAAETYAALSKHPNINGAKEASGNFSLLTEAMHLCGDEMNFWSGNDDQIVPLMAMGGKGVILGSVQRRTGRDPQAHPAVPRGQV